MILNRHELNEWQCHQKVPEHPVVAVVAELRAAGCAEILGSTRPLTETHVPGNQKPKAHNVISDKTLFV
jgi:hypothetical protein